MDIKITMDISLSDSDILIFRKFFTNKDIVFNIYFQSDHTNRLNLPRTLKTLKNDFIVLESKLIIKIDNLGNVNLTDLGKLVFDQIDRDKRIDDILN